MGDCVVCVITLVPGIPVAPEAVLECDVEWGLGLGIVACGSCVAVASVKTAVDLSYDGIGSSSGAVVDVVFGGATAIG